MYTDWDALTHNQKVERFLDTYRRIETLGEKQLGRGSRGSVLLNLAQTAKFRKYATELDCCREVRNLLSHEVKVKGEYPAVPSRGMQELLELVLRQLTDPDIVAHRMTPKEKLIEVRPEENLAAVLQDMRKNDLSFLPMLENGRVTGMFTAAAVLEAAVSGMTLSPDTRVGDLGPWLQPNRQTGHRFPFVRHELPVEEAEAYFDRSKRSNKVRLLLVTQNGKPEEKLLGVVSPYDLLN